MTFSSGPSSRPSSRLSSRYDETLLGLEVEYRIHLRPPIMSDIGIIARKDMDSEHCLNVQALIISCIHKSHTQQEKQLDSKIF